MKRKLSVIVHDGVSCVGTTLETYDNVSFLSQHIGNLTFSFVSPVCSHYSLDHLTSS